jgi:hypothetical protein
VLVTLGTVFHSHSLITAGTHIQSDKGWIFVGGLVMIVWMTAILIAGTKATFKWQNTFWFIASAGTLLAFVVLLLSSKSDFQSHFNALSHTFGAKGNAYQGVISTAKAQGVHPHAFGSATAPAIFVIMTFMIWNWWSVYLSGELKSASNRNRQMSIMFGALSWNVIGLIGGVLLLYKVTSYQFIVGANTVPNAAYVLPTGPFYHLFAGLAVNSNVLTTIIVFPGSRDSAGDDNRDPDAGLECHRHHVPDPVGPRRARRRRLRGHRRGGRVRVPDAPARPLQQFTGEPESPGHPGAADLRAAVGRRRAVPDLGDLALLHRPCSAQIPGHRPRPRLQGASP